MRLTNAGVIRFYPLTFRVILCMLLMLLTNAVLVYADISNVNLVVNYPGAGTGAKINGSGLVTLQANWAGDTPPFSASFKAGGNTLGTESTTGNSATFQVSGAALGHGDGKTFEVTVLESSVPNATSQSKPGDKSVSVDMVAPQITVSLNGTTFSNNAGNNQVIIQVSSDEVITAPTVVIEPPSLGATPVADGTNPASGQSFRYTLTLSGAPSGSYTVRATGRDQTEPATGANTGTGLQTFSVNASGPGAGSITGVTPGTPTNSNSITLTGTVAATMDVTKSVQILENGAVVSTGSISGGTWSASINSVTEGVHSYSMRGFDNLGNLSAVSAPFEVKVDRTKPSTPVLNVPNSPTNATTVTLSGTGAVETGTVMSQPVTVNVYDQAGTLVKSAPAGSDGSYSIAGIPLVDGSNLFRVVAVDSTVPDGNSSGYSNTVSITKDNSPAAVTNILISRTPGLPAMPLPVDPGYQLGSGNYKLRVLFGKDMDNSTNPVITVQTGGGSAISSSAGSWTASNTYEADIVFPKNGGSGYDGAASINVSGAKDSAGNVMAAFSQSPVFTIDSTSPVSSFDTDTTIYVSGTTPSVTIKGTVSDNSSGVGYVDLIWQNFTTGTIASKSVPIMLSTPSPWEHSWNTSAIDPGRYKVWVMAVDQAKPVANSEDYVTKPYRILIVDRDVPSVNRISLGNMGIDINMMNGGLPPVVASAVTRLTAVFNDGGEAGIAFSHPSFVFTLKHDGTNTAILGNYTNNGSDTVFFDFPELTTNGTYTINVTPVDKGGNLGASETRQIVYDKQAPDQVTFYPDNQRVANQTHIALSQDQVWATINHPRADYTRSTIEVRYNGNVNGVQVANGSTTAVVWDIGGPSQTLATNQSGDGRYDITVVPRDTLGNIGNPVRSFFNYDSVPPVVTSFMPAYSTTGSWFGLNQTELSITVSDAPKDIIQYGSAMPNPAPYSGLQIPGDPNWYNGAGSGFGAGNSSFTYTVDGVTSSPTAAIGNKMTLARPAKPSAAEAGVADVTMNFKLLDQANDGQVVPNMIDSSYIYKFDYLEPTITSIEKPAAGKNKYCKNVLTIQGRAEDRGTSADVRVKSIEWSENGSAWASLTTEGLPAKTASFSSKVDITARADGNYTINLRAVDLGDNLSQEVPVTFIVDRTPPAAPAQIVPLPDVRTNKRGQLFKWAPATDADRYLLQIADDPSFNNILNNQSNTGYESLTGYVAMMTEGSFSAPKDGTYYWRVASIETCADGFNISSFSETRRFTIDTVKPVSVEVQPAPSSGNKITTGMVTFTIRFSELIDSTIPPTVKITSAGGQMMVIEKVSYKEDTWTGTTVIPKNSSALYDGTAVISIEGATDLAGNIMAPDSTNSVVVNTGPAFTTKIFSNPANEYEIMIITKASEALQAPPTCSVQQSAVRTPIVMNFLKERYYAGSYKIDISSPGKAYIDMSGTDLHGMVGHDSVEFTVADLSASQRLNITSVSGKASLKAAEGSAYKDSAIFMIDRDSLESPFTASMRASLMPGTQTIKADKKSELVEVMALEEIGPASLRLKKCLFYTADIGNTRLTVPEEKVHLYRLDSNGTWKFQGGEFKDQHISAQLTGLGRLALMADLTEPLVLAQSPVEMQDLDNPLPEIKGAIADSGAGLKRDSFKLFINETEVQGVVLDESGNFSYKVRQAMPKGKHEIKFEVSDLAGNTLRKSFWVTAPGAFALDEFMPYPNPATGNVMHFNYRFNQNAERVRLKVYDVAGQLVADFDTFDFTNQKDGRIRWDMRNNNGKRVANGVYFYKLDITRGGQTFKKRGKFAVMR